MRKDIPQRREEIECWISNKKSKAFICEQLDCKPDTLDSWLTKMGIEYVGVRSGWGRVSNLRRHVLDYLKSGSLIKPHRLKERMLRDGIKEKRCERCGTVTWLSQDVPLELHHKDGNRNNNELVNLELLCLNCHSLTPNNSGRGKKRK